MYASTTFKVATSNGLGADTITRNVIDSGQTDQHIDRLGTKLIYEKVGITTLLLEALT